jgi:hypothetical protein
VIPVDGLIARGDHEHEFTLHQFTILPGGAAQKFKITQFDKITMGKLERGLMIRIVSLPYSRVDVKKHRDPVRLPSLG